MNPRDKAEELVNAFTPFFSRGEAIECAFIAASEILKERESDYKDFDECKEHGAKIYSAYALKYWNKVKEEIKNL